MLSLASCDSVKEDFCLPAGAAIVAKVIDVVDGDTLRAAILSPMTGRVVGVTVRLAGVDTAEVRQHGDAPLDVFEKFVGLQSRARVAAFFGVQRPEAPAPAAAPTGDAELDAVMAAGAACPSREAIVEALAESTNTVFIVPRRNALAPHRGTTVDAFGRVVADILPGTPAQFGASAPNLSAALLQSGIARPFATPREPWSREALISAAAAAHSIGVCASAAPRPGAKASCTI